jgi:hypothetical protein
LSPLRIALRALVLCASCALFFACGNAKDATEIGSETHFLSACDGGCAADAECVCGVCTKRCEDDAVCSALSAGAACVPLAPRVAEGRCADDAAAVCDLTCLVDADCAPLAGDFRCQAGYCRNGSPPEPVAATCTVSPLAGSDVAVIGDSLIELSPFTADLEAALVSAGALTDGEHVRDYASHLYSVLAGGTLGVATQWTTARAEGPVRVVVLDGGATDVLNAPCGSAPTADCTAVQAAASGAEALLAEFAADGVEHVVYAFYNDFDNAPVKAGIDVLRPFIENACGRAALPCEFLDLRPSFAGHPEYLGPDGIVWSDSGASASADAVTRVMLDRCVAWPTSDPSASTSK